MDVTRYNFKDCFDQVEKSVSEANFIAIDGEFSGVTNSTYNTTNYDSPEERYHKIRHNVSDFLLMQFGLVTFKWDEEEEKYISEAFNFYIFPFRSTSSGSPDRIFSCQSSSMDFLSSQRFDFNKVFHSGIPYLTQSEEAAMRNTLNEKHILRTLSSKSPRKCLDSTATDSMSPASSPTIITDPRTQAFLDNVSAKCENFLKNSKEGESLTLEPCNSYLRKILYEKIPTLFPDQPLVVEPKLIERTKQRCLVVSRAGSEEDIQRRNENAKAKDDSVLQEAVGFSRIIQLLGHCQKLTIGHNMLLDLMFTLQQFVRPLPPTLDEFKADLTGIFPQIIDTKLMGSMLPFRETIVSTTLGDLHSRLAEKPFSAPDVTPPPKYDPSKSNDDMDLNLHEAAYDAYITGVSFLSMISFLGTFRKQGKPRTPAKISSEIISPYVNKVYLMRSPDIPYLNLAGSDLSPSRAHVFHLQFPTAWRPSDIRTLFSPVGTAVNISWISDTQCFVGLYDKSMAKQAKKLLLKPGGMESSPYMIRTYEEYQREMAGQVLANTAFKRSYNHRPPHSKNKVWRPSNLGHGNGPSTSAATYSEVVASCATATPKSTITYRKRSGEDADLTKPSSVRRISSTSNRINCLDLDEPDVKRQRAVKAGGVGSNAPGSHAASPAFLSPPSEPPRDEEMEKALPSPKKLEGFDVPTNWG